MTVEIKMGETTALVQTKGETAMVTLNPVKDPRLIGRIASALLALHESGVLENFTEPGDHEMLQWVRDWQGGADNFRAQLMRLFRKADRENLAKLAAVYPEILLTLSKWERHEGPFSGLDYEEENLG